MFGGVQHFQRSGAWKENAIKPGCSKWNRPTVMLWSCSVVTEEASLSHTNQHKWTHKDQFSDVNTHTTLLFFWASPAFFRCLILTGILSLKKTVTKPLWNGRHPRLPSRLIAVTSFNHYFGSRVQVLVAWEPAEADSSRGGPSPWRQVFS